MLYLVGEDIQEMVEEGNHLQAAQGVEGILLQEVLKEEGPSNCLL